MARHVVASLLCCFCCRFFVVYFWFLRLLFSFAYALTLAAIFSVTLEHMRTFVQGYAAEKIIGGVEAASAFESWRMAAQGGALDVISEAHFLEFMQLLEQQQNSRVSDTAASPSDGAAAPNSEDLPPAADDER